MHHLPRWAHWGTIVRSRGMRQPPRWGHWGILTCLGALGYLGGTAPNAAGKLANRAKLGPFTFTARLVLHVAEATHTPPDPRGLGPRGPSEPRGLDPRGPSDTFWFISRNKFGAIF